MMMMPMSGGGDACDGDANASDEIVLMSVVGGDADCDADTNGGDDDTDD